MKELRFRELRMISGLQLEVTIWICVAVCCNWAGSMHAWCRSDTRQWGARPKLHSQGHAHFYSVANSTLLKYITVYMLRTAPCIQRSCNRGRVKNINLSASERMSRYFAKVRISWWKWESVKKRWRNLIRRRAKFIGDVIYRSEFIQQRNPLITKPLLLHQPVLNRKCSWIKGQLINCI